jgi:hypothetical protein
MIVNFLLIKMLFFKKKPLGDAQQFEEELSFTEKTSEKIEKPNELNKSESDYDNYEKGMKDTKLSMAQSNAKKAEDDRVSKKTWFLFVMWYLSLFTFGLFMTLWLGSCLKLKPTTLNILISLGFTKVVAMAYIVVKHFYPIDKVNKKQQN